MWVGQDEEQAIRLAAAKRQLELKQLKERLEREIWQRDFRLRQQLDQKWSQILSELEQDFLDREAFDGYRRSLRAVCRVNRFRIVDTRLL